MSSAEFEILNFQLKINLIMKTEFDKTENKALNKIDVMQSVILPNELRIGNLLYLYNPEHWGEFINEVVKLQSIETIMTPKEKEIWKNSFGSLKLVSGNNQFNQFSEYVKPIPLTEEWLFKLGFVKTMSWTFAKDLTGNNILVYYLGEKGFSLGFKNYSDFKCEYVHQLQNLYFALTQRELTIA